MEKADSKVTGYAIEWKVEPPLWIKDKIEERKWGDIKLSLSAEKIRAEIRNTFLKEDDFEKKATELVRRWVVLYGLRKGSDFKLQKTRMWTLTNDEWIGSIEYVSLLSIQGRIAITVTDAEGNVVRDTEKEVLESTQEDMGYTEKDDTAKRILNYCRLTEAGENITRNLYKVIDALERRFGKSKGVRTGEARSRAASELGVDIDDFNYIGNLTSAPMRDERHAPSMTDEVNPPSNAEINEGKKRAKKLIRAYVEWLKKRS